MAFSIIGKKRRRAKKKQYIVRVGFHIIESYGIFNGQIGQFTTLTRDEITKKRKPLLMHAAEAVTVSSAIEGSAVEKWEKIK